MGEIKKVLEGLPVDPTCNLRPGGEEREGPSATSRLSGP